MRVRLLTARVGNNRVQNVGDVVDVPNDEGQRMIERGQAAPEDSRQTGPQQQHSKR